MNRSFRRSACLALVAALSLAPLAAHAAHHEGDETAEAPDAEPKRSFTRVPAPRGIEIRRFNKTDGATPEKSDRVTVHYHGTFAKGGEVFDSSRERGRPATFPLNRVIPCWTEAVTRLHVGEKAEVVCPAETAYGARGAPPKIPPNADLIFEIELIGIQ
jgi:FKBP-type peptidyl-prolyl cis-trans isomerase FkpA